MSDARPVSRFVGPARRRVRAAVLAVVTVAAGLLVTVAGGGGALPDIAGDALYAVLIFLLAVVIVPGARPWVPALAAAAWCVAVELLQLTDLPRTLAALFPPARLVLGTAFDPRDLFVYVVAVIAAATTDAAMHRIRRRPRAS